MKARARPYALLSAFLWLGCCLLQADSTGLVTLNLPAGDASERLKQFAQQAQREILFSPQSLSGMETRAVAGRFTPLEALDIMLRGLPLSFIEDEATGALLITRTSENSDDGGQHQSASNNPNQPSEPMITPNRRRPSALLTSIFAIVGGSLTGTAQNPPADDPIVELSPFQVDSSQDAGYRATNTLAGTRTASNLRDVAAAVSVVTEQFMKDTGATNINELFLFLPNAEGTEYFTEGAAVLGGSNAFFTTGNTGQQQPGAANGSIPETGTNRLRGLENVTVARDFFQTSIPVDAYNIERVELNRGPNSVLFGLGKSSGILNYSLKRAQVSDNFGEISLRIGDEDSFRTTFDINRVLSRDDEQGTGLAVRFVALHEEGGFRAVEPAFDVDERVYGSVRWKPFAKTDIHLNYEKYERKLSRPSNIVPFDFISPWVAAGAPTWDPSVGGDLPAGLASFGARPARSNFSAIWDNAAAWESGEMSRLLQARNFNAPNGNSSTLASSTSAAASIPFNGVGNAFPPEYVQEKFSNLNTDPSNRSFNDDNAWSITLNQGLFDNLPIFGEGTHALNTQFTWFREETSQEWRNAFHEDFPIGIDVNETIPNGEVDANGNSEFIPNPNFLRPFSQIRQNFNTFRSQDQETRRAEATYSLNLPQTGRFWTDWLDRFVATALVQRRETEDTSVSFNNQIFVDSAEISTSAFVNAGQGTALINHSHLLYLGPPVSLADPLGSLRIDRLPSHRALDIQVDRIAYFNAVDGQFATYTAGSSPAGSVASPIGFGGRLGQEIDTVGITTQTFLLEDRVVFTYGYRKDSLDQRTSGNPQSDPVSKRFIEDSISLTGPNATSSTTEGETTTLGFVVHPFRWLSLHYNDAENFSPEGQRLDFFGNFIDNPSGKGKDYGFSLNVLEDKIYLKVNWFTASQTGLSDNAGTSFGQFNIGTFERDMQYALAELGRLSEYRGPEQTNPELFGPEGWIINLPADPLSGPSDRFDIDPRYRATTSFEAEGVEIEVIFNPFDNWRIMANVSRQETVQGLIAPRLQDYLDVRLPYWQTLSIWNETTPFFGGGVQTPNENWQERADLFQAVRINENKINDQLREWRYNLVTTYDFVDGPMKNFSVGGAAHWLDKAVVGFGTTTAPDGSLVLDPKQPFYSDSIFDIKLWMKYTTTLYGLDAEFQVNWENLLEGDKLRVANMNADGTPKQYSYNPPERIYLTARLSF